MYLNGQPVERSGQTQVCLDETITYWLEVDTGKTVEQCEIVIAVAGAGGPPPEEPPSQGASPDEAKHVLARQFKLPQGNVAERLFEPPLFAPTVARSQSGMIFVAHGGIIVCGPGDTAFIGVKEDGTDEPESDC